MRDHAEPIPDEGTVAVAEVRLQAVTKTFGRQHVIQDLDLCINDGEFCVILGPSGCGKSTLLRLIAGLEEPTSGRICIGGTDVTNMPPKQRRAAMVFQSYALYPHMTAYGNMAFGLKLGRKRRDEVHRRVREAARILHIEDLLDRKPAQLSGGQQQRVAIGRAMVREPSVFLFDEPLSNLDSDLRGRMRTEFVNLHRRLRSTMVYVTHDQTEAMTLADRLVLVRDGVIVQTGSPMTLYRNPKSLFVAKFLGSPKMNLIPGRLVQSDPAHATVELVDGSRHRAAVAPTESAAGTAITLGVRPEALSLHGRGMNRLDGIVCMVEQLGDHVLVHVDWHATADTVIARGENGIVPRVGERVKLSFRPETCYLFSQNERAWPRNESTTTSEAGPSGSG